MTPATPYPRPMLSGLLAAIVFRDEHTVAAVLAAIDREHVPEREACVTFHRAANALGAAGAARELLCCWSALSLAWDLPLVSRPMEARPV